MPPCISGRIALYRWWNKSWCLSSSRASSLLMWSRCWGGVKHAGQLSSITGKSLMSAYSLSMHNNNHHDFKLKEKRYRKKTMHRKTQLSYIPSCAFSTQCQRTDYAQIALIYGVVGFHGLNWSIHECRHHKWLCKVIQMVSEREHVVSFSPAAIV